MARRTRPVGMCGGLIPANQGSMCTFSRSVTPRFSSAATQSGCSARATTTWTTSSNETGAWPSSTQRKLDSASLLVEMSASKLRPSDRSWPITRMMRSTVSPASWRAMAARDGSAAHPAEKKVRSLRRFSARRTATALVSSSAVQGSRGCVMPPSSFESGPRRYAAAQSGWSAPLGFRAPINHRPAPTARTGHRSARCRSRRRRHRTRSQPFPQSPTRRSRRTRTHRRHRRIRRPGSTN